MNLRSEYLRPQLARQDWLNLNGEWDFSFDDENRGVKDKWFAKDHAFGQKIQVPRTSLNHFNDKF